MRMEKIGFKIRIIRDHFQLSQERFGHRIGVSGKTISSYENHKAQPPLYVLERISEIYKVKIFDLPREQQQKIESDLEKMAQVVDTLRELFRSGLSL